MRALPIFLTFFVMGFGDIVGAMVGFVRSSYGVSAALAGLLPLFGFIAYGILSVPAGFFAEKFGKKKVLLLGLGLTFMGFLLAMLKFDSYLVLLAAILMAGSGLTIVQVAGNPMMREVSAEKNFSRNLTFAQFIKSIGSMSGPLLIALVIGVWTDLFPIYVAVIAVTLVWVTISVPATPPTRTTASSAMAGFLSSFKLLGNGYVFMMVMAIFLYVGAEVGVNSWIASYLNNEYQLDLAKWATLGIGFFFFAIMVGRFLGSIVLHYLSPRKFFLITSLVSCAGIGGLFFHDQWVAVASIVLIGLGFASIFPLVFSLLIDAMPDKSNELSGLMCMAIVGGAIMPFFMGTLADASIKAAFLVPLVSLVIITVIALYNLKPRRLAR